MNMITKKRKTNGMVMLPFVFLAFKMYEINFMILYKNKTGKLLNLPVYKYI